MSLSIATGAALAAPLSLWLAGAVPGRAADQRGALMARVANGAAWLAFVLALVALLDHVFGAAEGPVLASVGLPFNC